MKTILAQALQQASGSCGSHSHGLAQIDFCIIHIETNLMLIRELLSPYMNDNRQPPTKCPHVFLGHTVSVTSLVSITPTLAHAECRLP